MVIMAKTKLPLAIVPKSEPLPAKPALLAPVGPVLAEVQELLCRLLPPDVADNELMAVAVYLETHPTLTDALHSALAAEVNESADIAIADEDEREP